MNRQTALMKSAFRWANEQIATGLAGQDHAAVKKAVTLAGICISDPEEQAHLKNTLLSQELNGYFFFRQTPELHQDLPFFVVYEQLTGNLPVPLRDQLREVQQSLKQQLEAGQAWQSLGAWLLLTQVFPETLEATPPARLTGDTDLSLSRYLCADNLELNNLIYTIHIYSGFGTGIGADVYTQLVPVLEVRMIAALKNYDLIQASALLQALNYLEAPETAATLETQHFLMNNQSREGFIGYYEREFLKMNLKTPESQRHFRLSSTLISVIALLEHNAAYRFYRNVLRS